MANALLWNATYAANLQPFFDVHISVAEKFARGSYVIKPVTGGFEISRDSEGLWKFAHPRENKWLVHYLSTDGITVQLMTLAVFQEKEKVSFLPLTVFVHYLLQH